MISNFLDICKYLIPPTSSLQVITVPSKVWRSKAKNCYKPITLIDVNDYLYFTRTYGKEVTRSPQWKPHTRTYLTIWDKPSFNSELTKDLRID